MKASLRSSTRAPGFRNANLHQRRQLTLAQGDQVLLREVQRRHVAPVLTRPLKPGKKIESHNGIILHDEIIGKSLRDTVTSRRKQGTEGSVYRIHEVKLEEWVRLTQRLVTPIYPADANLIIELFDIHVSPPSPNAKEQDSQRLEILEAGTGHGALTIYLSRAIHAANSPRYKGDDAEEDIETWKGTRRAILHTIEKRATFSAHAAAQVAGFRRGLYSDNVDFHVGDVGEWCEQQLAVRGQGFLNYAFLDMPGADQHLKVVTQSLKADGTLIVFNPSITQIADCASTIWQQDIPLYLEKTVELGQNAGSGGREWDIRLSQPKAERSLPSSDTLPHDLTENVKESSRAEDVSDDSTTHGCDAQSPPQVTSRMVCRPKVGDRIAGGGFVGVFKKM
ncbi:hypothetical protein K431DRAFT_286844, partial [Polychaeton citri CBS 116435]